MSTRIVLPNEQLSNDENETSSEYEQLRSKMNGFIEKLQKIKEESPEQYLRYLRSDLRNIEERQTLVIYARMTVLVKQCVQICENHPEFKDLLRGHRELFQEQMPPEDIEAERTPSSASTYGESHDTTTGPSDDEEEFFQ